MYNSPILNLCETVDDLSHDLDGLCLRNSLAFRNKLCKITTLAKFCNDVGVVLSCIDVIDLDNIAKGF